MSTLLEERAVTDVAGVSKLYYLVYSHYVLYLDASHCEYPYTVG